MPSRWTCRCGCRPGSTGSRHGREAASPRTSVPRRSRATTSWWPPGPGGAPRTCPSSRAALAPSIRQLHSTEYQRPSQLSDGPTLVVGASHSGCEIAYELAEHLPVTLCGRYTGNEPFAPGSGRDRIFTPLMVLVANHVLTRRTPPGRKVMRYLRGPHHGAPTARIKRRHLAERGVRWLEQRVTGVSEDGKPVLADGTVLDVTTVIWCTGFEHHFEWIDLPVFDEQGWPREYRGVVDEAPGLFFCGLVFQYAFSSMVLPGVGRDAAHVAGRIAEPQPRAAPGRCLIPTPRDPPARYRQERR